MGKGYSESAQIIFSVLGDRPVAYHPGLAKAVGGVKQAIFVSQLLYWNGKGKKAGGWIYKTQKEIEEETGLSRREMETVRRSLKKKQILEEKLQGVPATLHYKLNTFLLYEILQKVYSSLHESAKLDSTNGANKNQQTVESIPENTQENTQESTNIGTSSPPPADDPPKPLTEAQLMFGILAEVTGMDQSLGRGHLNRVGKELRTAGYTAAEVQSYFGKGKTWWYLCDWRGQKQQQPILKDIKDNIKRAREWDGITPAHQPQNGTQPRSAAAVENVRRQLEERMAHGN